MGTGETSWTGAQTGSGLLGMGARATFNPYHTFNPLTAEMLRQAYEQMGHEYQAEERPMREVPKEDLRSVVDAEIPKKRTESELKRKGYEAYVKHSKDTPFKVPKDLKGTIAEEVAKLRRMF